MIEQNHNLPSIIVVGISVLSSWKKFRLKLQVVELIMNFSHVGFVRSNIAKSESER